jgi:hypothetical protein
MMTLPRGVYPLLQSQGVGRRQTSASYCSCSGSEKRRTKITDIGPILEEIETRQRPEWKDIANRCPTYKSYWAEWKLFAVRNSMLVHRWESTDRQSHISQIVLPRNRVKDVLTELHGRLSGGHLGVNKTPTKFRQRYYWLQGRSDIEKWC